MKSPTPPRGFFPLPRPAPPRGKKGRPAHPCSEPVGPTPPSALPWNQSETLSNVTHNALLTVVSSGKLDTVLGREKV